ncbi:MAG: ribosome small subunit-dependent GTPase A [Deltaproteobacteria bacterium]|nr:ribosome small subunit-dependent GTPase A [Deltaproteobacteria bacterium]
MSYLYQSLPQLGWSHFFQQQLSLEEWQTVIPSRVTAVHGQIIDIINEQGQQQLPLPGNWQQLDIAERPTVGDWLVLNRETGKPQRVLARKSLFKRKAAGIEAKDQLIAANIDTLFIVTSCNQDFNLSRLERYLALAYEAEVEPIVVLTKADLVDSVAEYVNQARTLKRDLIVEAVNSLDNQSASVLSCWCGTGQTVALTGSSGVGKSTLINTLCQQSDQTTANIREDDAKGRHTTTSRSLHFLPEGGILIDNPGMRELQLVDCEDGLSNLFEEIEQLVQQCKFNNCQHTTEKGCAVIQAIENGDLDQHRLASYQKLKTEQMRNSETISERRTREKGFVKMCRNVQSAKRERHDKF